MESESPETLNSEETVTPAGQTSQPVVETPGQQPAAPEELGQKRTPEENRERAIAIEREKRQKAQQIAKELETENAKLRSQASQVASSVSSPASQSSQVDPQLQDGMKLLQDVVESAVAPIRDELSAAKREQITEKFWTQPLATAMAPEIKAEFQSLPETMPYEQRLNLALGEAMRKNLDTVTKVYQDLGREEAYNNQSLKRTQSSPSAEGGRNLGPQKNLLERLQSGEIKPGSPEYIRHRQEILNLEQEQFLS